MYIVKKIRKYFMFIITRKKTMPNFLVVIELVPRDLLKKMT